MRGSFWNFVLADVDIAAAGIERGHDLALSATGNSTHLQKRYCCNGLLQHLSQSLHRGEADPQASKRTGPGSRDERTDGGLHESVSGKQFRNLWNELRGKSAAYQWRNLNHLEIAFGSWVPGSRQRDAALLAGGIDGEKKHKESKNKEIALSVEIRGRSCFYSCTSSSSTPPVLEGCTKTYWCPPAPVLISSDTSRTPSFFRRATDAGKSETFRQT